VTRLRDSGGRVAVLGFCLGGGFAITAGVKVPGVSAVVCFYGIPPAEEADPAELQVPFLGHFATKDGWITPERVKELEGQLRKAKVFYQINHYEADHAFFNERRERYSRDDAEEAWDRTRDFFSSVLS
jgi:carboxymethylenebutenolidase